VRRKQFEKQVEGMALVAAFGKAAQGSGEARIPAETMLAIMSGEL